MMAKSVMEKKLMNDNNLISIVIDIKSDFSTWERQQDPKMIKALGNWGESPKRIKTMILVPYLGKRMKRNALKEGWNESKRCYVRYITICSDDLDYKDYSMLGRAGKEKSKNIIGLVTDNILERIKSKGEKITYKRIMQYGYKYITKPYDRMQLKFQIQEMATTGLIQSAGCPLNMDLLDILKFCIKENIRVIQFAAGYLAEGLEPICAVFVRKILQDLLSIQTNYLINKNILLVTPELNDLIQKQGSGFYAEQYLLGSLYKRIYRKARSLRIQTIQDTQIASNLPDFAYSNTETIILMKCDDMKEAEYCIKKKLNLSPSEWTYHPPTAKNLLNNTLVFDLGERKGFLSVPEAISRLRTGKALILHGSDPYYVDHPLCPSRTWHRRKNDRGFPAIERVDPSEIIEKVIIEKINWADFFPFDELDEDLAIGKTCKIALVHTIIGLLESTTTKRIKEIIDNLGYNMSRRMINRYIKVLIEKEKCKRTDKETIEISKKIF
jgi:hypothetical protein